VNRHLPLGVQTVFVRSEANLTHSDFRMIRSWRSSRVGWTLEPQNRTFEPETL